MCCFDSPSFKDLLYKGLFFGGLPVRIFDCEVVDLKKYIPKELIETGFIRIEQSPLQYLVYSPGDLPINSGGSDNYIRATCNTIIKEQICFASINLNHCSTKVGKRRGGLQNPIEAIKDMLVNDNCILEYLDLSYSGLSYSELNDILEAIPQESQLKCLYLGEGAIYTNGVENTQKERLAKWLNETSLDIAIVGAFSPNANNQDERGMLDNYYSKHIAKLADVAHTMQPEKSLYPYKQAESSRCANRFK